LYEKTAIPDSGLSIETLVECSVNSISKELVWKLYNEAAQMEDRANRIDEARKYYVKAVQNCPRNLIWKVWMSGARTELNYNNIDKARQLLQRAQHEVCKSPPYITPYTAIVS
jgi:tetratricopeptide (TPR) repeat protein